MKAITAYIKSNWLTIVLAVIAIFLLFIIFRGCNNGPSVVEDSRKVDSLAAVVETQRISNQQFIIKKEREVDSLKAVARKTQLEAQQARREIRRIIAKGSGVIAATPEQKEPERNFDSLATAFTDLSEITSIYIDAIDTLMVQHQAQIDAKDSIIEKQKIIISELRKALAEVYESFKELTKNYNKAEKRRKFKDALNRVFAVAILVLGTIVALK